MWFLKSFNKSLRCFHHTNHKLTIIFVFYFSRFSFLPQHNQLNIQNCLDTIIYRCEYFLPISCTRTLRIFWLKNVEIKSLTQKHELICYNIIQASIDSSARGLEGSCNKWQVMTSFGMTTLLVIHCGQHNVTFLIHWRNIWISGFLKTLLLL